MIKAFKHILVVVKQTPYESYLQLKAQGKAPVALRWERLKNRYDVHRECVKKVTSIIESIGIKYSLIGREEMYRGSLVDKDLVIAVGGDGTILNVSSFLDDTIPVLGVNSDPTRPEEQGLTKIKDERRSRGALCATSANNVEKVLPEILYGNISPGLRTRLQCVVQSTYTETRLPPALNDILLTHPIPAAVSRYRMALCEELPLHDEYNYNGGTKFRKNELFSFNVWSSGMWVSTATGSTAAMHAAGGFVMDTKSSNLQYIVREHLVDEGHRHQKKAGHGIIRSNESLYLRWNSQFGSIFVDGSHFQHSLELGDEINISNKATFLKIFDEPEV